MGVIVKIISFTIFLAAFLFCAVGYGAPWWIEFDGAGVVSYGLFQWCLHIGDELNCETLDTSLWSEKHKATVAMMTIGLAVNVATIVLYGMTFCGDRSVKSPAGASLFAGICQLIGVIVYGSDYVDAIDYLDWAFWVACVGGAGHIANSIITFILDCISCC
ncbi:hypothetical protein LSH36_161g02002 [Paralvinella palmiformis]|uniref:Uncharacterized protein n=1 Tax=Paralvinella palmiformis TaxID=53620 RepID=A0AAD9N6T9_9ANNE|nr:hypothetical protein LSH36_161g02002 [Paralvinella palmiformis]